MKSIEYPDAMLYGFHKPCKSCNKDLPIERFPLKKRKGKVFRYHICMECKNMIQREYYHKNKILKPKPERRISENEGYRICTKCGDELPVDMFYVKRRKPDKNGNIRNPQVNNLCKKCFKVDLKKSVDPVKQKIRNSLYKKNHREQNNKSTRKWKQNYPERYKASYKKTGQRQRAELRECYIKSVIDPKYYRKEIPQELVEVKRDVIILRRAIKAIKKNEKK